MAASATQPKAVPAPKEAAASPVITPAPKKKFDFMQFLTLVSVIGNLAAAGGLGYFMQKIWERIYELEGEISKLHVPEEAEEVNPIGKELAPATLGLLYQLEGFLVNLASDQGPKFLQTQIELEYNQPQLEDELSRKKAAIRDAVIVLLSSRSYRELRDPGGMKKLRQDLLRGINSLLSAGKIRDLYFTQFHFS